MTDQPPDVPRDTTRPPSWREREEISRFPGAFLDPSVDASPGEDVHSTFYAPDVLLITPSPGSPADDTVARLNDIAAVLGWVVSEEPLRGPDDGSDGQAPRLPSVARTVRGRIAVAAAPDTSQPVRRPDAWRLLREARRAGIPGLSLNHVITVDALELNPFKGNPFKGNPFKGNPFKGNPVFGAGIDAYAVPGMGGRQTVVYTGPAPARSLPDGSVKGRRPVVAVFDTGCGEHDWLDPDVVVDPIARYGGTIGIVKPASDPERHPSLGDPLDGVMDDASGHGTFIAGIVLQACPDVEILPVRVSNSQGVILEDDLTDALGQLVGLLERGKRIDVLNLSFSYFHETPDAAPDEGELYSLLARARARDCIVVCSAGNEATDRPSSPASLYAYPGGPIGGASEAGLAPHITVGALNPSRRSVAMFSNVGDWVTVYAAGVSVLSTMPRDFDGGAQADLRHDLYGRRRETLDVDDFGSGFAVWSGTSFAAPLVAGRIAAGLAPLLMPKKRVLPLAAATLHSTVAGAIAAFETADGSSLE